jgi:cobalt/nickel transport system permease protein
MEHHLKQLGDADHPLARIDARVKIVAFAALLIMVLSHKGFFFPLFLFSLSLAVCGHMNIPFKHYLLRFSEPLLMVSILLLIKLFLTGSEVLFSFTVLHFSIVGHLDGLMDGLAIAARIIGAISLVAILGFTTPFTDFVAAMSWFRIPKTFTEIVLFAYRYIFVLFDEAMVIYHAQRNRLGYSSLRRGLSSFGILTGSLTIRAFEHSQNVATSMIQRGYDGTMPVSGQKPLKPLEIIGSFLFLALMGLLWKM